MSRSLLRAHPIGKTHRAGNNILRTRQPECCTTGAYSRACGDQIVDEEKSPSGYLVKMPPGDAKSAVHIFFPPRNVQCSLRGRVSGPPDHIRHDRQSHDASDPSRHLCTLIVSPLSFLHDVQRHRNDGIELQVCSLVANCPAELLSEPETNTHCPAVFQLVQKRLQLAALFKPEEREKIIHNTVSTKPFAGQQVKWFRGTDDVHGINTPRADDTLSRGEKSTTGIAQRWE